ncbi:MAG: transglycosylase SLT domain-containing protein [Pseudomonadota bacterium]
MKRRHLTRYLLISLTLMCMTAHAGTLSQQRWQFKRAYKALKAENWEKLQQISTSLQDYPLYYYLRYHYLKERLKQVRPSEIQAFLKRYGDTYFGKKLRQDWLNLLAGNRDWAGFVQDYTPQKSTSFQCHYAYARLMIRQNTQSAISDAKKLWLVGKSQPNACTPLFDYLYEHGLIDNALIWGRIGLAMKKGELSLASFLAKRLDSADSVWVTRWQSMHKKPAKTLAKFNGPDLPVVRDIILHGIRRLARQNFERANDYWNTFQRRYAFSVQQIGEMQRELALASAEHEHPLALKWLTAVNKDYLNDKVSDTRIKLALKKQNWYAVVDFITELPDGNSLQWRYWLARALEQTGKNAQAQQIYKTLAKERDYYGFLAADRIGAKYHMQHHPIVFTSAEKAQVMKHPCIGGAHEFYKLSQDGGEREWYLNAKREWRYAIQHLPARQQAIAIALASHWGWHYQAIMAAAKAGYFDALEIRFPLAFHSPLAAGAKRQGIDLAWVYGIVRQETAFKNEASSHVGALGLMQLMPATARSVAKKIGLRLKRKRDIFALDTNIRLGTAYLQQMLDRFDGNYMLATAAYNAGPGRAKRWAAKNRCMPSDLWVEMIPFDETRKYVRRVLFYTRIFEERLQRKQLRPLRVTLVPHHDSCTFHYAGDKNSEKVASSIE